MKHILGVTCDQFFMDFKSALFAFGVVGSSVLRRGWKEMPIHLTEDDIMANDWGVVV